MKFRKIKNPEKEIWKEIEGFAGKYFVSNLGRVKSHLNKIYSLQIDKYGYFRIILKKFNSKKSYNFFIHRLVAQAFIPNPEGKKQINHKDGNKSNNFIENLEWVTNQENNEHAIRNGLLKVDRDHNANSKLTQKQADEIISLDPKVSATKNRPRFYIDKVAKQYLVSKHAIRNIWAKNKKKIS